MELPPSMEGLQMLLDSGVSPNDYFAASDDATEQWTLLHWAAFIGESEMVPLLLQRGASMKILTSKGRSALDVASDADNWDCFQVLGLEANWGYPLRRRPYPPMWTTPGGFYPSKFYLELEDPFEHLSKTADLREFDDMIQDTRALRQSGKLSTLVPYPEDNEHLVALYQQVKACAARLEAAGKHEERALAFAKFWLHRCIKHHFCSTTTPYSTLLWPSLPKRVVDVSQMGEGVIKLVDGFPRRAPYCAVSYRWRVPAVQSTQESIREFMTAIPLDQLQPQLRDAFFVANKLGINYVWVDALCIIQESAAGRGDFDEEAPKMASVYGNATLTVAFADNVRFGVNQRCAVGNRAVGELDSRGWALQEQLLSHRVLYVTQNGLYWECLENSMSESCPCGIPGSTDNFRSVDQRRLKIQLLQTSLPEGTTQALLSMWRRTVVEEYTQRHLTCVEDRVVAVASITSRVGITLNDTCILGIWKNDIINSLFWHTAEPCSRPRGHVYPTWSWYSVQGRVAYSAWTPFSRRDERGRSSQSLNGFMEEENVHVLDIHLEQEQRSNGVPGCVYRGHVKLQGVTVRAYFASGDPDVLFFPRKRGAKAELIRDLKRGTLRPARHDGGEQPEHNYCIEFPFVDTVDFPGNDGYREVLCMVMGRNKNDGFPIALILEKTSEGRDQYRRVGTVAIDTRQILLQQLAGSEQGWEWSDVMGVFQTVVVV